MSTLENTTETLAIRKLLVANRGEIARRVFRTLRRMGIASVAVFTDVDADAPHVVEADEAVRLGSVESYLDMTKILDAARVTGADAVHPGYGFLSENADFAEKCQQRGLTFIGPSPEAMRSMADKASAKALAASLGVPVLDGFALADFSAEEIREQAERLGYPLLLKAVAGGGGRGMRRVDSAADLHDAMASASREAEASFGDGGLLIEKLVERPRHVEVQILGDCHGTVRHLFERDCSMQRRHQKVVEEAPSPGVDSDLRDRLTAAAVALGQAVAYEGAGTVEFLVDEQGDFYFLEMNTRLQVEHPVTEAITGLDLVRWQIDIARGRSLRDLEVSRRGHAIEVRLYGEDACRDFLPVTGTVALWQVPTLPGLRIDSGVEKGSAVSSHYDSMLAKIIAHGEDRPQALARLRRGLQELAVGGLVTNRDFLLQALEAPAFEKGEVDTSFIERHLPAGELERSVDDEVRAGHAAVATLVLCAERRREPGPLPNSVPAGWRNNRWRPHDQAFADAQGPLNVHYVFHPEAGELSIRFTVSAGDDDEVGELSRQARLISSDPEGGHVVEIDGIRRRYGVGRGESTDQDMLSVHGAGEVSNLVVEPRFPPRAAALTAGGCVAPMTGKVIEVPVAVGDPVRAGTVLVVLEAMKMEHRLVARAAGQVSAVNVEVGQMVDPDEILVVVDSA